MANLAETNSNTPMIIDLLPANIEYEINRAKQMRGALDKLFKELLVQKVDFDRVPGTDRPTLLKPGGELLCQTFHLAPGKADVISQSEDFQTGTLSYILGVPIYHRDSGVLVSYGVGSANSKEPKYRYRKETVNDEEIRVENPDPAGQQNTLVKMASKRAFIDGVLKATGASRMFTQDVEDFMMPEKASSKQINYIKTLFKGKSEADMVAEIQNIIGHDISSLSDVARDEASKVIEAKKSGNGTPKGNQPSRGNSRPADPETGEVTGSGGEAPAGIPGYVIKIADKAGMTNDQLLDFIQAEHSKPWAELTGDEKTGIIQHLEDLGKTA